MLRSSRRAGRRPRSSTPPRGWPASSGRGVSLQRDAAPEGLRIPLRVRERRGDDVLLHAVRVRADPRRVVCLLRPALAEGFEGPPADAQRVGLAALTLLLLEQIALVGLAPSRRIEPVREHLARAVEGDVLRDRKGANGVLLRFGRLRAAVAPRASASSLASLALAKSRATERAAVRA